MSGDELKVSLVATVKDAASEIPEFLASVAAQTRAPDEVVICDGGSVDGTVDVLRDAPGVTLLEDRGANIARGRNVAVRAATHDVIAVSDGDCVLTPRWLEEIVRPIESGADVAMGTYRPIVDGVLQACAAAVAVPDPDEIRADRFLPSSRSVAFRRDAFEAAGGYPEWLDVGEDMYLDLQWRRLGTRMELAPSAVALWRVRPSLGGHWRQYARYAEGDALAGMHTRRHVVRFAVYGAAAAATSRRGRSLPLVVAAGAVYAARPVRRAMRLLERRGDRALAVVLTPALMAFTDLAKMAGYSRGLLRRWKNGRLAPSARSTATWKETLPPS